MLKKLPLFACELNQAAYQRRVNLKNQIPRGRPLPDFALWQRSRCDIKNLSAILSLAAKFLQRDMLYPIRM